VLSNVDHVGSIGPGDAADLVAFLLSVDASTEPFE